MFCFSTYSKAQVFVVGEVTDGLQIAGNAANTGLTLEQAIQQLLTTLDGLDIMEDSNIDFKAMKGWLNDVFGEGSSYMKVYQFLRDSQQWVSMINSLNSQMKTFESITKMLSSSNNILYNAQLTTSLIYQANSMLQMVQRTIDQTKKLLEDTGISKSDKIKLADEAAQECEAITRYGTDELLNEVAAIQTRASIQEAMNFLAGNPPGTGLSNMGSSTSFYDEDVDINDDLTPRTDGSSNASDSLVDIEARSNLTGSFSGVYALAFILLGLLSAMSLVIAYVRYTRGDYQGEFAFIKVAAGLLIFTILLVVLNNTFKSIL